MKNDLPDEKFDQLMRQLLADAALDESQVNDIADSPTIWWGVQRRVSEQTTEKSPWPPVRPWRRWLMIGVPAATVAVLAIAFLINRSPVENPDVAQSTEPQTAATVQRTETVPPVVDEKPLQAELRLPGRHGVTKALAAIKPLRQKAETGVVAKKPSEVKTDFIALTYARDPDSGQIVRVRVPSSLMVTLGVVATVKKPTDMVDAEVLVGDDGLTRAIRFIR